MGLSIFYGTKLPDSERHKFLDHVYESGENFWDSSDVYGDSEDLLGQWFKRTGKRHYIFLATKFANVCNADGTSPVKNDPDYIRTACARSHQRLGLEPGDIIDLYYCHRIDPNQPIEITVTAMVELKKEGKIKYLRLSESSAETLRRACKVHHIAAVQVEYSPFSLEIETNGLLEACRNLGVAVVTYSLFSRGFFTGTIKSHDDFDESDRRRVLPRCSRENFPKNMQLVNTVKQLADKRQCTSGQLTLAWLMAQGNDIIPIPGTTKVRNFDENMDSLQITLTDEEETEIWKAVEVAEITGDRYPAHMLANLYVDTAPLGKKE
ncbi:Aldo/keto reductase [Lepidopterella palustris CBS 459.81]|uniref:Aldo/keto reductase n=1 Tax=Lepidopterella palustris CBS 459.81 TaxID=1314670 RepID=A0A8E2ECV2_9PEZI|nr:Aldo/keto reductase [Lepidopterella palustris CBS 459.81]